MTITISYRDQNKTIQLSALPEFNRTTAALLQKTDIVKQNQTLKEYDYALTSTLKGRAASIETVSNALNEIQEHKTREVICACLKTLFVCAMIAGIVLLGVFGGEFVAFLSLGVVAYMLFAGLVSLPSATKHLQFLENSPWSTDYTTESFNVYALIGLSVFAPFLPLYEVLTRQGRIERVQNKQNTEMNRDLVTFLKFADELANNLTAIRDQLNDARTKKDACIAQLKLNVVEPALKEAMEVALSKLEVELAQIQETQGALTALETYRSQPLAEI